MIHLRNKPDIRLVGSTLVAVFDKAEPPLIWRFDLSHNHSFTLGLQDHSTKWELGVTTAKGEFHSVARFPVKEDAEDALALIGGILAQSPHAWIYRWVKNILILIVLFFLAAFLSLQVRHATWQVRSVTLPAAQPLEAPGVSTPAAPAEMEATPPSPGQSDTPLPADDGMRPPDSKQ